MEPEIRAKIKELSLSIKHLKQMAGITDDEKDEDLEDTDMDVAPPTKEVGRGRKKRTVPTLEGQFKKPEDDEEMAG